MSTLSDLLRQVEQQDSQLAADLRQEVKALESRRAFGLNFERHVPETVELPGRPVRKGDKVRFLPERGEPENSVDGGLWLVKLIRREGKRRIAELVRKSRGGDAPETYNRSVDDLVVLAEFRDPIYPGLVSTGTVERGGEKPYHSVINAENYHALQALLYTHEGKVDAIYIDPPYNTRDKDWKYNNDFVDKEDRYRHSKWLAMMERRIRIAKRLLNLENSVLIVTIDENEVNRLALLLEQVLPEASIQMVSTIIAPQGSQRSGRFSRIEEHVFYAFFGDGAAVPTGDPMIITVDENENADVKDVADEPEQSGKPVTWDSLIRRGTDATRESREDMFYPIHISRNTREVIKVGHPPGSGVSRPELVGEHDTLVRWPIRTDGSEGRWQLGRETFIRVLENGMARVGRQYAVTYLKGGTRRQIETGEAVRVGTDKYGYPQYVEVKMSLAWPRTLWNKRSHNASVYGSTLLRNFIPRRKFPFPKSLYAVEDTLRFFIKDKPNAVVLDFFAGSGTTAHAVKRLNRQDRGRRQCISVTNNEVSVNEQKRLRQKGLRPGESDWEQWGICDHITKPRIKAAITGQTPEGNPIKGDYKFKDEFPMADGFEENVEFFTMTYEAPRPVAHHKSFAAIAPLLWLKAGAQGRRIEKATSTYDIADTYAVLFDLDALDGFLSALGEARAMQMAFIVTDDDRGFQAACGELPDYVEAVRLYESYLTNFAINTGRG